MQHLSISHPPFSHLTRHTSVTLPPAEVEHRHVLEHHPLPPLRLHDLLHLLTDALLLLPHLRILPLPDPRLHVSRLSLCLCLCVLCLGPDFPPASAAAGSMLSLAASLGFLGGPASRAEAGPAAASEVRHNCHNCLRHSSSGCASQGEADPKRGMLTVARRSGAGTMMSQSGQECIMSCWAGSGVAH